MTEMLGTLVILSMLLVMAARTLAPVRAPVTGQVLLDLPLGPMYRLLDQRINILAILIVLILGSGLIGDRWISHETFLFAIVAIFGLLCIPTRYRLTTTGISPNRATFRTWSDFAGWESRGNVVRLRSAGRFGSLTLYVSTNDRARLSKVLERCLPAKLPRHLSASASVGAAPRLARRKGGTK
jgi:hypothetical protein